MAATPETLVREFCAAAEKRDAETMRSYLAEDVVYHNIPMDPAVGIEAALGLLKMFFDMCDSARFEITHLAADGPVVLTERVDTFIIGDKTVPLPVMGIFEIADGRIAAWRDYFDLAQVTAMFGG